MRRLSLWPFRYGRRLWRAHVQGGPVSRSAADFIRENAAFWREYGSERSSNSSSQRYVLVEQQSHPVVVLSDASFAAIVCHARNARPLFILDENQPHLQPVLASYPGSTFFNPHHWRYIVGHLGAVVRAMRAFRHFRSPADILAFESDGIRFGDILYDGVLSMGYATVRRIDWKLFRALLTFYSNRYLVKDLLVRYRIEAYVSHAVGIQNSTFARYLLAAGVEVLNRLGSHQIHVKKWRSLRDNGSYPLKAEQRYFRFLLDNAEDLKIHDRVGDYLEDRFGQRVDDVSVDAAFDRDKRIYYSKTELGEALDLDPSRKFVFVMLHCFNDYPHSHFAQPMLFRDYFDWFEQTLEIARCVDSVNWVFKEHPASKHYITRDLDLDAYFASVDLPHIRYLNDEADFNAQSVGYIADAIVTCLGTAGLEYSCVGIPCILAGESAYSGFGFTIEPSSAADYWAQLRNIRTLEKLTQMQIRAARVVLYFRLIMMPQTSYYFCPQYHYSEIWSLDPDVVWRDAASLFSDENGNRMRRQVEVISEFLTDESYTQYVDLDSFPFMRHAIGGKNQEEGLVSCSERKQSGETTVPGTA